MKAARVFEKELMIPTYDVGKEEKNPMFFEKRVYQGSSGRVYPNPVIEKIEDVKKDRVYRAVILENDYVEVTVRRSLADGSILRGINLTDMILFIAITSSSRHWLACWGHGSAAALNSTGRSTIALPPICRCAIRSKIIWMAALALRLGKRKICLVSKP